MVASTAPTSQQAGYYCEVCDCVVKDSANYLDHINGKKREWLCPLGSAGAQAHGVASHGLLLARLLVSASMRTIHGLSEKLILDNGWNMLEGNFCV